MFYRTFLLKLYYDFSLISHFFLLKCLSNFYFIFLATTILEEADEESRTWSIWNPWGSLLDNIF